jgi:hypothetical protein
MVRLQAPQRLMQHLKSQILVTPMSADLGHQEHAVALTAQAASHPNFGLAAMVSPTVVEEKDASIDGASNNCVACFQVFRVA